MTIKSHIAPALASAAFVVGSFAVLVPVAGAATPPSTEKLAAAKARCDSAITRRQTTLTHDSSKVAKLSHLSVADRADLTGQLDAASSGLTQLKTTIDATTTASALRDECKKVATEYRVYVLDGAKVRTAVATNRLAVGTERLAKLDAKLPAVIERATKRGVSPDKIADAQQRVTVIKAKLADATSKVYGRLAQVLALTPAQVDDHSADAVLTTVKSDLVAAKADGVAIRTELKAIRADLRRAGK